MSAFGPGQRVLASFQGGPWQPASVLEVNQYSGLLRVRLDDGRESWLAAMNVRTATNIPAPPVSFGTPASAAPAAPNAPVQPPVQPPTAPPVAPPQPPADSEFKPIAPAGRPVESIPATVPGFSPTPPNQPVDSGVPPTQPGINPFEPIGGGDKNGRN